MNKKIICICVTTLVILSSLTTLIVTNNVNAEEPPEQTFEMLPLDYMWFSITKVLADVITNNEIYPTHGEYVRKGRAFGSVGGDWTAKFLNDTMHNDLNLENVKKLRLGPIKESGLSQSYKNWYYTSILDINDLSLTINDDDYPFPNQVPKNETFAFPSSNYNNIWGTDGFGSHTYNRSFDHVRVYEKNISEILDEKGKLLDTFGGRYTGVYLNVSNCHELNYFSNIVANVVYVPTRENLPVDQEEKLFLIPEEEGCQEILDNVTNNASGILLLHNTSKSSYNASTSNVSVCIARTNNDEQNLTEIISLLQNGTFIIADNIYDNQTITFQYDFENVEDSWYDHDFVFLTWLPTHDSEYFKDFYEELRKQVRFYWLLNEIMPNFFLGNCYGFIVYDVLPDCHFMDAPSIDWVGWSSTIPGFDWLKKWGLPMFSVNYSVGYEIKELLDDEVTISGFIDQEYIQETHEGETWTAGVEAYNVEGNITIPHSPDDAIICISNRYDGWYSPASGDSGLGAGIVLGIAKYMKDNNIQPKYNLTFLMTTGEEYGFRGAWHYSHSHPDSNIIRWIGLDQLGFKQEDTSFVLEAGCNQINPDGRIVWEIVNQSGYTYETENEFQPVGSISTEYYGLGGTDDVAWRIRDNCNTICFSKHGDWVRHHKAGVNYTEGDTLQEIDRNDANWTFKAIWDTVKYFCVNPNCSFVSTSYEAWNTSGGTAPDSIKTIFNVKSILPSDLICVNASLYNASTNLPVPNAYQELDFVINNSGVERNITITMPSTIKEGDYYINLTVYNSTNRINRTLGFTNYFNDTQLSPTFHLSKYHTLGDIRVGTSAVTIHDHITGSRFTPSEYAIVQNITAYLYGTTTPSTPTYQCMIYRYNDGQLIANTIQVTRNQTGWYTFTFNPQPVLLKNNSYVLAIWGNNSQAKIYSTYQLPANAYNNGSYTFGTPPETITWDSLATSQRSIFCQYIPDTTPAEITNVAHTPDNVGYGFNITISAGITDDVSGVNHVNVQITSPNGLSIGNNTMTNTGGNTYQYITSDIWALGQYNYTIWVIDNAGNINNSGDHHFHLSINATISIATLQDNYTGNQYINITDPPDPPEDYTLVDRGLTWNEYYNAVTGQNILEVSTGPVNYQEDNETWMPINTTLSLLQSNHPAYVYGYRNGNNLGLYGAFFKANAQHEWPIAFTYNRSNDPSTYAIRSKLMGVGYIDPASNWAYKYLQNVQSSEAQVNDNSVTYENVFTGTDVTWRYDNTGLKEEITLSNTTKTVLQNHPPSQYGLNDTSSYLVFITKLEYQNLNLYNASGMLSENVTISDAGVDFKDTLEQLKCSLPLGEAYELNNASAREKITYRIVHLNDDTYLLSGLKLSALSTMTFPVIIDPTMTVYSTSNDGYIYNSSTNYNTARSASTGTVDSSGTSLIIGQKKALTFPLATYYIYRGFLIFNTSALPSNAYIENATLGLYKSGDSSTTDFLLNVQNGQPTYPHNPLQSGDYNKNHYTGNGGTLNTSNFVNGCNNITLNSDGKSWLNRTGLTKLCLRSSRDINGNTPTGNEYVTIYANEMGGHYQPTLTITYRNQSKIKNTGSTDFKGYLLIQIQYYNAGTWIVDNDTVNETFPRTININDQLALDRIFNGRVKASDLKHGNGTYRVYTALRDPDGDVLRTETVSGGMAGSAELKAWWLFTKI